MSETDRRRDLKLFLLNTNKFLHATSERVLITSKGSVSTCKQEYEYSLDQTPTIPPFALPLFLNLVSINSRGASLLNILLQTRLA